MKLYTNVKVLLLITLSFTGITQLDAQSCGCLDTHLNGSFEDPNIANNNIQTDESNVPGWNTSARDNRIEIWKNNFLSVPAVEGNQFIEINATQAATIYQELCLEPGTLISWSIYHRGRNGVDVASIGFGASLASISISEIMSDGKSWGLHRGTYTVPAGQTTTIIAITAMSTAGPNNSYGNLIDDFNLSITHNPCDSDGDGIADVDEDYPNDPTRAFDNYFPAGGIGTLMFEDLWPYKGDYDFNDIVVDYQFNTLTNSSNKIVETHADFTLRASGARYENGFGFQLPSSSILPSQIKVSGGNLSGGLISTNLNGLEVNQNLPTIMVFDNAFDLLPFPGGATGVNTKEGTSAVPVANIAILILYEPNIYTLGELNIGNFNPFIFVDQDRSKEVHLPNYQPTALADMNAFGSGEDDSNLGSGRTYRSEDNLPWALNVIDSIPYPKERIDIIDCYLLFDDWAQSNGTQNANWFQDRPGYRVNGNLY